MTLGKALASTAIAVSLIGAPIAAQAAASVQDARVGSRVEGESLASGILLPVLAAIVLGLIIWQITDDGDEPTSP